MIRSARRRAGFTLIELITVVAIMLVLAAMIVGVAYSGANKQLTTNGSTAVVGWLKTMQAYALRDQKPYGLRLRPDVNGLVTTAQYIEQPVDWVGPIGSSISAATAGNTVTITGAGVDFSGGFGGGFAATWPVQPGDCLECNSGKVAVINGVSNSTTLTCTLPPGDTAWTFTGMSDFRIVRQPRAMIGADALNLPSGVAINTTANTTYTSQLPLTGGNIDVLFAPTGAVITSGLSGRDIRLWVVDTTQQGFTPGAASFQGEPLIVTVAIRTGMIGIQSVAPGANPYAFSQDGKSSGY